MSSSYPSPPTFRTTLRTFAQSPDRPFAGLLTEVDIPAACDRHQVGFASGEHHVWTPALTLPKEPSCLPLATQTTSSRPWPPTAR